MTKLCCQATPATFPAGGLDAEFHGETPLPGDALQGANPLLERKCRRRATCEVLQALQLLLAAFVGRLQSHLAAHHGQVNADQDGVGFELRLEHSPRPTDQGPRPGQGLNGRANPLEKSRDCEVHLPPPLNLWNRLTTGRSECKRACAHAAHACVALTRSGSRADFISAFDSD